MFSRNTSPISLSSFFFFKNLDFNLIKDMSVNDSTQIEDHHSPGISPPGHKIFARRVVAP